MMRPQSGGCTFPQADPALQSNLHAWALQKNQLLIRSDLQGEFKHANPALAGGMLLR